jgi:hypothetical protein
MISSELNLNRFTVHQILTWDMNMKKLCSKIVPKNLMTEQKANWMDVCIDFLYCLEREPELLSHFMKVINCGF